MLQPLEDFPYSILLYYCYTPIEDPNLLREVHHLFCLDLNLTGRIIIASEGINGTVSGTHDACELYVAHLKSDSRFAAVDFKIERTAKLGFNKMHVRVKSEIVHADLPEIKPYERTGKHLSPSDFKALKDNQDVVLLDVRSNYEHQVGKFKNAITLDIENFRDFPDQVVSLAHLKDKKVITYCTGGIKCEKASAYLLQQGFKDVYQLHGGIIKYGIEEGGEDFDGKCYVFDNRITTDVNIVNPVVISTCYICGDTCDRMINCADQSCNNHIAMCESCANTMAGACSNDCYNNPLKRPYDGSGYYQKNTSNYNSYKGVKHTKFEA